MAMRNQMLVFLLLAGTISAAQASWRAPELLRLITSEDVVAVADESDATCGPQLSIETPACEVVGSGSGYELRKYPNGLIWAENLVANSSYSSAIRIGFYRCFFFISGQNSKAMSIEMTGPVHITPAPEEEGYKIAFFVPSRFKSVNDLPRPLDSHVKFDEPKGAVKAVIGPFGGFADESAYQAKWQELKKALDKDGTKYDEKSVVYAGYSSPFQFKNRKQEVHVTILP